MNAPAPGPRPFPVPRCVTSEGVCFAGMQRMTPGEPLALVSPEAADVLQAVCHELSIPGPVGGPGAHVSEALFVAAGGAVFLGRWRGLALYRSDEAVSWFGAPVLVVPSFNPGGALKAYGLSSALLNVPGVSHDDAPPALPAPLPRGLVSVGAWGGVRLIVSDVGPRVLVSPAVSLDAARWG